MTKPSSHHSKVKMNRLTVLLLFNLKSKFNKNIINNRLIDFHDNSLKKGIEKKKPLLETRQVKSLQNLLIRVRLDVVPKPVAPPQNI